MKKVIYSLALGMFSLFMIMGVNFVFADKYDQILDASGTQAGSALNISDQSGLNTKNSVPVIIGNVIKIILGVSGTVALIFIIMCGVLWMISKGDTAKIGSARKLMTSGMIGIAIIAAAYAITDFVIKQITVIAG